MITANYSNWKMIIHSLSKMYFPEKFSNDNTFDLLIILAVILAICEGQRERDETALPASLRIVLFRVVQEGLNNIAKYSGAARAWIAIVTTAQGLTVIVRDDGRGFAPETAGTTPGLGLKSMRERVELSGGTFRLDTAPGKGVRIRAHWSGSTLRLYDSEA